MIHDTSNLDSWRRLFDAAIRFKQLACWNWMGDEDYFAITNPATGELGYCVVNGADGMEFGLNVYYGPKADIYLQEYLNSDGGLFHEDKQEMMHSARAVCVTFEDRSELDKDDLQLIRMLAYKFRGSSAWPLFRHYEPGFSVWGLNSEQVGFLTAALEQAVKRGAAAPIAQKLEENESALGDEFRVHAICVWKRIRAPLLSSLLHMGRSSRRFNSSFRTRLRKQLSGPIR